MRVVIHKSIDLKDRMDGDETENKVGEDAVVTSIETNRQTHTPIIFERTSVEALSNNKKTR